MSRYDPSPSTCIFQRHSTTGPWFKRNNKWVSSPQKFLSGIYDESNPDFIRNSSGLIRWAFVRLAYLDHLIDIPGVVGSYREWRDTREDLWLDAINNQGEVMGAAFIVAAKRGNEWYKERLNKKFSFFEELPPIHFFCEDWGHKTTPMLFITLTVSQSDYTIDQAWNNIGEELHLFETKLRQEYGTFVKLRVWEAHASGYPHCHVVYYFHHRQFEVWEHFDKKKGILTGNRSYRVSNAVRDSIRSFWGMGSNVDIQGVSDTIGALSEVRKYVTKTIWSKKGDLTAALCCLFNKQVYWLSQNDYMRKELPAEISSIKSNNPFRDVFDRAEATKRYVESHLREWSKKDFIGAIWGPDCYRKFYRTLHEKGFDEGMTEPTASALVNQFLHSCNKDMPDFDHFEFRGCYKHADLVAELKISDAATQMVDPPPDEMRYLFGVEHDYISRNAGGSRHFSVDFDGVTHDKDDIAVDGEGFNA